MATKGPFREGADPKVFGVAIQDLILDDNVPRILRALVDQLFLTKAEQVEGIFRIPGNKQEVEKEKSRIDSGAHELWSEDPNVVGSLLKLWFRELPTQLIPATYAEECLSVSNLAREQRGARAVEILSRIPEPNRSTCKFLIHTLQRISAQSETNKMNNKNLAMVFAPSLLTKDEESKRQAEASTTASGNNQALLMAKMSMDVDSNLAFVIGLLEDLKQTSSSSGGGGEGGFLGWLPKWACLWRQ
eukprot:c9826_g1_i1.p1 GENE.c9826_g1_i1~~c9826_g1_i1.p1  ORF type:complete len:245 (-),score=40.44 c9826_g1_i1:113-847(-)